LLSALDISEPSELILDLCTPGKQPTAYLIIKGAGLRACFKAVGKRKCLSLPRIGADHQSAGIPNMTELRQLILKQEGGVANVEVPLSAFRFPSSDNRAHS
jgi:hypothetical protein